MFDVVASNISALYLFITTLTAWKPLRKRDGQANRPDRLFAPLVSIVSFLVQSLVFKSQCRYNRTI